MKLFPTSFLFKTASHHGRKHVSEVHRTWIDNRILSSKAWLSLGGKACQVYMLFLKRRRVENIGTKRKKNFVCTNGNKLTFSYREACSLGMSPDVFSRAIGALVEVGLLDIVKYGGGTSEQLSEYRLSDRWQSFGTNEFMPEIRQKHNRGFCKKKKENGE